MTPLEYLKASVFSWVAKSAGLPVMSTTGNRYIAPDRRAFEQQAKAYLNQVVLACIATRAQTLNEPALTAVDPTTKEIIPQHPLTRLFKRPNKHMSQSMFWQYVSTYVDIGGNAYIHKVRNVYGQVIELRPYHSGHIVPISESGQWIDYYQYSYEGHNREIDPRDIIHIRSYYIDPLNPILGISPIRAAGINIDTYNELMQTLYSYLRNNGVPSGVLSVQSTVSSMQAEQLKEQFQTNTTGKNRGKPIVLPAGMNYTQMGLDVSKLEASSQFAQYEVAICGVYRVDPSVAMTMAGLQASTYNNKETAFREYTLLTRVPTWNTWEEQVELSFSNEYPEVDVEFDLTTVAALQASPEMVATVTDQFASNIITVNEARQRLGFPPLETDGDKFSYSLVAAAPAFGMLSEQSETPDPTEGMGLKWKPAERQREGWIDQSSDVKAESFWRGMDTLIKEFANELEDDTSKLIAQVEKVMVPNATKGLASIDVKADPKIEVLIQRYMKSTGPVRERLVKEISKLALQEVGADLTRVQSFLDDILKDITTDMASKISKSIGNIQKEVQDVVRGMPGASADDIEEALTSKFDTLKSSRAAAIARTTARAASTQAATGTWDALNDEEEDPDEGIVKVWTTRRDAKVRESHKRLDGKWVEMDAEFEPGLDGPGVGSSVEDVVNCRCVLRPVRRKNIPRQAR